MSLLKKIVEFAEKSDNVDAKKQVIKLTKDVITYKEKVRSLIDANYIDFLPSSVNSNDNVLLDGDKINMELKSIKENLNNEIKNMNTMKGEISVLNRDLNEAQAELNLSLKLVKIDTYLHKIKVFNETKKFEEIHEHLKKIEALIDDPDDNLIRQLKCIKNMKLRISKERVNLMCNLEEQFNQLVDVKLKNFPKTRVVNVIISKNIKDIVKCVHALGECECKFDTFISFIMDDVLKPVIGRAVSLDIKENDRDYSMSLAYSLEPVSNELRPSYVTVFNKLEEILKFFFLLNITYPNSHHFLATIFTDYREKIINLIFSECLVYCIPNKFEEKNQSTMKDDVRKLIKKFHEFYFFENEEETNVVEEICKCIDKEFIQQFTKTVQASVTELLKQDLHNMIEISNVSSISTATPLVFPKSQISKSTLELIKILEKIINEEKETDNLQKVQDTVKSILENYTFTIELHHSQLLSKIPQQSALFYNNCNYLSNWALTNEDLNFKVVGRAVHQLMQRGEEFFECQIDKQKIQLLDILKDFDLSSCLKNVEPEHFKPIRQCLRQMELLKNVWQQILPSELYNKTMGGLVDYISLDLIKKITAMEDISTILATALVDLIKIVDEKGQALFEVDINIRNTAASWEKLINLQFILDASLVDIQASWKDGRLSKNFKADEVKRLIRALYQNTQRRANCLQTIV